MKTLFPACDGQAKAPALPSAPLFLTILAVVPVLALHAESGRDAWLRYAPVSNPPALPAVLVAPGTSPVAQSARNELLKGIRGMLGRTLRLESTLPNEPAILLKTQSGLSPDAFQVSTSNHNITITGATDRAVLYGVFAFLRKIATGQLVSDETQNPAAPLRWVNEWNNLDGSIERGYGGRSIFWDNNHVRDDLTRAAEYARLLASIGINACSISNVNANPKLLTPEFLPQIARIADAMRPWGVQVAIAVDFGSPQSLGGLDTFDPVDPKVADWWKARFDAIYAAVPDLAGVVLKADSEGRVGPSTYHRTHAEAANVVARALRPHGGVLFYRGFVYDHHADWRNPKNDRGRAAYDNFHPLDGQFDDNVIVQIKHGPIDFQVREPASPLFGALEKTNQAIELQITQEYFGQARHTVFLVPMWKSALDFDMRVNDAPSPVKSIVTGKTFHRPTGGFVGVSNVGLDDNWTGNHLSQANLYGFGRLAWNPDLTSEQIEKEWSRQTFGSDPRVLETVDSIQLTSWRTYENYTGPLGLQTLTDITGNHYSVNVEASERNGWGQWHFADEKGAGMDRTLATGTGYTGQYRPAVTKIFESVESCSDDIVLFFHHLPYTHKLHDGKTIIQYLYDAHYEGADAVAGYRKQWQALKGRVDDRRYGEILAQLQYQSVQAEVWRDAVNNWFHRASGIADAKGRVGRHPGRYEAEAMKLEGYQVRDVAPWEAASGGKAIACPAGACSATLKYDGDAGWHTLHVQYFDQIDGVSKFRVFVNNQLIDEWTAADRVPSRKIDAGASARRTISGIALRRGDDIRIEGTPDGNEPAPLDYVEILP